MNYYQTHRLERLKYQKIWYYNNKHLISRYNKNYYKRVIKSKNYISCDRIRSGEVDRIIVTFP